MKKAKKNLLSAAMLLASTIAGVAGFAACSDDPAPVEETTKIYADFEQWAPDFQLIRTVSGFGKCSVNTDSKYVKSGNQSLRLQPLGSYRGGSVPYIFFPTHSDSFGFDYRDFTKVKKVSFDFYNAEDEDVKMAVGAVTALSGLSGTCTDYQFQSYEPGWNKVEYVVDANLLAITGNPEEIEGVYLAFENAGSRLLEDAVNVYVDDVTYEFYTEKQAIQDVIELEANELCDFEKDYQNYVVKLRQANAKCGPEFSVVGAQAANGDEAEINPTSGEKMLRVVAKEGDSYAATWPGFSLAEKMLRKSALTSIPEKDYALYTVCFDVYNNTSSDWNIEAGFYGGGAYKTNIYTRAKEWMTCEVNLQNICNKAEKFTDAAEGGSVQICWPEFVDGGAKEFYFDNFRIEKRAASAQTPRTEGDTIEDFASDASLENIVTNTTETRRSTVQWIDEFEGATGVAKIVTDYCSEYMSGYLSLKFNWDQDAFKAKTWDYITVRVYLETADNRKSLTLFNSNEKIEDCKTGEWVELLLDKSLFLSKSSAFGGTLVGNESEQLKLSKFVEYYACDNPGFLFGVMERTKEKITYYIDDVSFGSYDGDDVTAPTITRTRYAGYYVGDRFAAADTLTVQDDRDRNVTLAYALQDPDGNDVDYAAGACTLNKVGVWKLTVTATDKASNQTVEVFEISVMSENELVNFDAAESVNEVVGDATWLESFTGEDGVTEYGVVKVANEYGALRVKLDKVDCTNLWKMFRVGWDYIDVRMYIADDSGKDTVYRLMCGNVTYVKSAEKNKWITVRIPKSQLYKTGSPIDYGWGTSINDYNNMFVWTYAQNEKGIGMLLTATWEARDILVAEGKLVTYYVGGISYGKYDSADTAAPTIDCEEVLEYAFGDTLKASSVANVFDDRDLTPAVTYELRDPDGTVQALSSANEYKFTRAGTWTLKITATDESGNTQSKTVRLIVAAEGELLGFNTADSVSSVSGTKEWLQTFAGRNGVVKYTAGADGAFKVCLDDVDGSPNLWKMFKGGWDYIEVDLYIEDTSADVSYDLTLGNLTYAANEAKNQWIKVRIEKSQLYKAGSPIDLGWGTLEADYNNCFIYIYSTQNGTDPTYGTLFNAKRTQGATSVTEGNVVYYIDSISYGKNATTQN